jgi:hypothetical protein
VGPCIFRLDVNWLEKGASLNDVWLYPGDVVTLCDGEPAELIVTVAHCTGHAAKKYFEIRVLDSKFLTLELIWINIDQSISFCKLLWRPS